MAVDARTENELSESGWRARAALPAHGDGAERADIGGYLGKGGHDRRADLIALLARMLLLLMMMMRMFDLFFELTQLLGNEKEGDEADHLLLDARPREVGLGRADRADDTFVGLLERVERRQLTHEIGDEAEFVEHAHVARPTRQHVHKRLGKGEHKAADLSARLHIFGAERVQHADAQVESGQEDLIVAMQELQHQVADGSGLLLLLLKMMRSLLLLLLLLLLLVLVLLEMGEHVAIEFGAQRVDGARGERVDETALEQVLSADAGRGERVEEGELGLDHVDALVRAVGEQCAAATATATAAA